MTNEQEATAVAAAMARINRAWLDRKPDQLAPLLHPDVTMAFPGFGCKATGRDALVAGFADFCANATVHEYREGKLEIDVAGCSAVVTYTYEMTYERGGERYRATGRDLWVFCRQGEGWLAAWRTMLDVQEPAALPVDRATE
jgi:uncharacterized protein (TIGR02246 family)